MSMSAAAASLHGAGGSFRLDPGEILEFHRVRGCDEVWILLAGGPLELHLIHADGQHETRTLTVDAGAAGRPATTITAGTLRAARLAPLGRTATLRRAVVPGQNTEGVEVPRAAEILREHPLHEAIIDELTTG